MTTKLYGFLYKKLRDDLRDSSMFLDYSYCAKEEGEEELAKYFGTLAAERLNKSFKETHAMFENCAQKEEDLTKETVSVCLWEQIHEEMIEEYEHLLKRLAKL